MKFLNAFLLLATLVLFSLVGDSRPVPSMVCTAQNLGITSHTSCNPSGTVVCSTTYTQNFQSTTDCDGHCVMDGTWSVNCNGTMTGGTYSVSADCGGRAGFTVYCPLSGAAWYTLGLFCTNCQ
jgi:hypothetical protein